MYVLPIYDEERHRVTGYCEVTEEVYRAYWQEVEHARWLEKQARSHEISWQGVPDMPDEDTLSFHAAREPPSAESAAQSAALQEALAAEPPELVEALWALANGEITYEEIAQKWGVNKKTAWEKLDRAHARLREKLSRKMKLRRDPPQIDEKTPSNSERPILA